MLENLTDPFIGLGRTLQISVCVDDLLDGITLLKKSVSRFPIISDWETYFSLGDGFLGGFCELLDGLLVMSKILFTTDENNRKSLAEMKNFRYPLLKSNTKLVYSPNDSKKKTTGRSMYLLLDIVKRIG